MEVDLDAAPEPKTRTDHAQEHADADAVDTALRNLPPDQAAVVILVDGDGCSYQEAATVLGVREGTIARSHKVRVLRDSVVVRDGSNIQSLRHFKDDAKEVKAGRECGIRIEGFDDVKPDDVIEAYEIVKVARSLEMTQKAEIKE